VAARVLVLSDIFGLCAGLERLLADLSLAGANVQVIDPYQGRHRQFTDEANAYAEYIAQCGHDTYATIAVQALQSSVLPYDIALGFSAGATALWRALAPVEPELVKRAILFYPGQIHQHLSLKPRVPTQIIFGNSEPHFAMADICRQLKQQEINAVSTSYAHGFMNPASKAFDEQGYQHCLAQFHAAITT